MSLQVWLPLNGNIENKGIDGSVEMSGYPTAWYPSGLQNTIKNTVNAGDFSVNLATGTATKTVHDDSTTNGLSKYARFEMPSGISPSWHYMRLATSGNISNLSTITASTKYTVSLKIRANYDCTPYITLQTSGAKEKMTNNVNIKVIGDSVWHTYHATLTTIADFSSITVGSQILYMSNFFSAGNWIEVKQVKLSLGSVGSEYIPYFTSDNYLDWAKIFCGGKAGRYCASFNEISNNNYSLYDINRSHSLDFIDTDFSWSCWVNKHYKGSTAAYAFGVGYINDYGKGWGLRVYNANNLYLYYGSTYNILPVQDGVWTHVTFVYNSSEKKIYIYRNGELFLEKSFTGTHPTYAESAGLWIGRRITLTSSGNLSYGNAACCELNDLRIYNHVLSISEIKEIYKTLVLHYKMDDDRKLMYSSDYSELSYQTVLANVFGKKHLSSDNVRYLDNTHNGYFNTYNILPADQIYNVDDDGWISLNVESTHFGMDASETCYNNCAFKEIQLTKGYYRLSVVVKNAVPFQYSSWAMYDKSVPTSTDYLQRAWEQNNSQFNLNGNNRGVKYFSIDSNKTVGIMLSLRRGVKIKILLCKCYSNSTYPWVPYDFNNCIDSSGFGYDGKYENIASNTPSMVYTQATCRSYPSESGGVRDIEDPITKLTDEFTIAFWAKHTDNSSTYAVWNGRTKVGDSVAVFIINGKIRFDDDVEQTTGNTTLVAGQWNHVVCTFSKTNGKKIYVNGVIDKQTTEAPSLETKDNQYASIGFSTSGEYQFGTNYLVGWLSDFRIYMTEFSDEDVRELYNVREKIDKNGNIYGKELIEDE